MAFAVSKQPQTVKATAVIVKRMTVGSKVNKGTKSLVMMVKAGENNRMGRVFFPMTNAPFLKSWGMNLYTVSQNAVIT